MKKNGFIATSLIYSFFLIFITLFLGVIAKYLQNRILLSETEATIKAELNNKITIKDINVGDYVAFMGSGCNASTPKEYVVANVIVNNSSLCGGSVNNCLILYNFKVTTSDTNALTHANITNDIIEGYRNETYLNKILYTYTGGANYNLASSSGKIIDKNGCTTNGTFDTKKGCIKSSGSSTLYRERYVYPVSDILSVCTDLTSSGSFYFKSDS